MVFSDVFISCRVVASQTSVFNLECDREETSLDDAASEVTSVKDDSSPSFKDTLLGVLLLSPRFKVGGVEGDKINLMAHIDSGFLTDLVEDCLLIFIGETKGVISSSTETKSFLSLESEGVLTMSAIVGTSTPSTYFFFKASVGGVSKILTPETP